MIHEKITGDKKRTQHAIENATFSHNDQLKLVLMRQIHLKKASLEAKSMGDVNKAVELLAKAKSLNQMIEAAECGLPVNVKEIPIPPLPSIEEGFSI